MVLDDGESEREVLDFLAEYALDRDRDRDLPLAHYLSRYPGREEAVAREFLLLRTCQSSSAGTRIGPYERIAELGRGGQGVVWLAKDTRVDRHVALKLLHEGLRAAISPARFRREAALAARIDHAGIDTVYDIGEDAGHLWLATRYVPGESLATLLQRARDQRSSERRRRGLGRPQSYPLRLPDMQVDSDPVAQVRAIARAIAFVARALHAAHQAGVVHRDVKPGNLLIPPGRQPVLVDFGLACAIDADAAATLTLPGDVLGTPAYMAPELLRQGVEGAGPAADIWALGVVLYECLTLERPFGGATPQALQLAIAEHAMPSLPPLGRRSLTHDLEIVLRVALAKEPAERYQDAATFADDLQRIANGHTPLARPPGPWRRTARFAIRHPWLVTVTTGVIALLVLAMVYLDEARRRADAAVTVAETRAGHLQRLASSLMRELHTAVRALPGATEVNRDLLEAALTYLELLDQGPPGNGSPGPLRDDIVLGHLLVGDVLGNPRHRNLGDPVAARRHYELALQRLATPATPADTVFWQLQAGALLRLGELDARQGALAGAVDRWRLALAHLEPARITEPIAELQVTLHMRLGESLAEVAPREAMRELGAALRRIERIRGATPDLLVIDLQEISARLSMARLLFDAGRTVEARAEASRAGALLAELPPPAADREQLVRDTRLAAAATAALLDDGSIEQAELRLQAAVTECAAACAADPRDQATARLYVSLCCDRSLLALRLCSLARSAELRALAIAAADERAAAFGAGWATQLLARNDASLGLLAARRGFGPSAATLFAAALRHHRPHHGDHLVHDAVEALRWHLLLALQRVR